MTRVYSRVQQEGGLDVRDRDRPAVVRHAVHESREAVAERADVRTETDAYKWVNPSNLDAPPPRQGMVQRWIADGTITGSATEKNWQRKMREGWSPRDPSSIPAAHRAGFPSVKLPSGQDVIRIAGLVLCEMPKQIAMQRHQAINDLIRRQSKSMPDSIEELNRKGRAAKMGDLVIDDHEAAYTGRKPATMVD